MNHSEVFADIVNKLGITVEYAWPKFVEYTYVNNLTGLIVSSVLFVISFISFVIFVKLCKKLSKKEDLSASEDSDLMAYYIFSVISVAFSLISLAISVSAIPSVIAPEGAAIKEVMKSVSN